MNIKSNIDDKALFAVALQGFQNAYAPYSKFRVGAAILADNGNIYGGANVENAAYPQGNCAEASAIAAMIYGGALRIEKILIIGQAESPVMPCGGCRQRISEFASNDCEIIIASPQEIQKRFFIAELLPHQFGKDAL